jgi:hypothetical protein
MLGIGTYGDTPGSPSMAYQFHVANDLLGAGGWVVVYFPNLIGPKLPPAEDKLVATLRAAYARSLRVILRLGWSGAMRDYADEGSNRSRYTQVADNLSDLVHRLPLPPRSLSPLLLHAGNEVNACNEWRCSGPAGVVLDVATRAAEAGGFMADVFAAFSALPATKNGSLSLAHASIANWQVQGCECGTNANVGAGESGTVFLKQLLARQPSLYSGVHWLSSHSYPYSNANYSTDVLSKAFRGLTYYRAERAVIGRPTLKAALTETGWARHSGSNEVSADDQATWMRRAAEEIWAPDATVLSVCPFLLVGRFWEAKGWNFLVCPPGNSSAPCPPPERGELDRLPVYHAWKAVGARLARGAGRSRLPPNRG